MKIDVKAKKEDGSVLFEGSLNRGEVSYLLQFAINALVSTGVVFNLNEEAKSEDDIRMKFTGDETLQ